MENPIPRCERCGAPLPGIEAVCPRCENDLATPQVKPAAGKYRCPACHRRFDRPASIWLPRNARWYRPQRAGEQCPHCSALLRDRKTVRHSTAELAAIWIAILAAGSSPWSPWAQMVLGGAYLLVQWVRWNQVRSLPVAEEDRFALESPDRS